jgi:DNA primase
MFCYNLKPRRYGYIKELLKKVNIVEVLQRYLPGLKLNRSSKTWWVICPFHQEKTPSFCVFSETQQYHCYGCGAHGNAMNFLLEWRMTPQEAIRFLQRKYNHKPPHAKNLGKNTRKRKAKEKKQQKAGIVLREQNKGLQNLGSAEAYSYPGDDLDQIPF